MERLGATREARADAERRQARVELEARDEELRQRDEELRRLGEEAELLNLNPKPHSGDGRLLRTCNGRHF